MPIYHKDGKTVMLVHIPKTGGTSIEETFRKEGWEESYFNPNAGERHQHAIFETWSQWDPVQNREIDEIFTVVRNPEERLRSDVRGAHPYPPTMEAYIERLTSYIHAYKKNPNFRDNHIRPQWEYLPNDGHPATGLSYNDIPIQVYYFDDPDHRRKILERYNLETKAQDFPWHTGRNDRLSHRTELDDRSLPTTVQRLIYTTFYYDYQRFDFNL